MIPWAPVAIAVVLAVLHGDDGVLVVGFKRVRERVCIGFMSKPA